MTIKEKFDDIIMRVSMKRIVKRAKRMYEKYGDLRLTYEGVLVSKKENKKEVYNLPSRFHKVILPDNYREDGVIEDKNLSVESRNLVRLINAISAEIKHQRKYCERYAHQWFMQW